MFVRSRWSMMFVLIITNHYPAQVISRCAGPFRVRNEDIIVSPPPVRYIGSVDGRGVQYQLK